MFDPGRTLLHPMIWWAVLCGGVLMRLAGLGAESIWLDEGFSVHLATAPELWQEIQVGSNPPLFSCALHGWVAIGGLDEAWLRLLPALASIAALFLFAVGLRRCRLPGSSATLVLALYAGSPFLCWYAHELRSYSFLELGTAAMFCGWRFVFSGRARLGVTIVTVGAAWAAWSHYFGTFAVAAFVAVAWLLPGENQRRWPTPVSALLGFATVLPAYWMLLPVQMQQSWGAQSQLSFGYLASLPMRLFVAQGGQLPAWLVLTNAAVLSGLALLVIGQVWRGRTRSWPVVAVVGAASPIAIAAMATLVVEPRFTARYFIMVPLYLCLGLGLAVADWPARRAHCLTAGVCALFLVTNLFSWRLGINDGYREACAELRSHWQDGDRVGTVTGMPAGFGAGPLLVYLDERMLAGGVDRDHEVGPGRPRKTGRPSGRLHLIVRWAPYTRAHLDRLLAKLPVAHRGALHNRVQHLLVEWP